MIQDIGFHIYKNKYENFNSSATDSVLIYDGRKILLKETKEGIVFPLLKDIGGEVKNIYFFTIDEQKFFHVNVEDIIIPEGFEWKDIYAFREMNPKHLGFAAITGWQLYRWYDTRKFCGRCGSRLIHDEKERMMKCPECGLMEFPKICPAVIVGVTHGNRILMSKYAGREYTKYALLAGFTEVGETLEETIKREVLEEVGVRVKNIRYYKSQPWSMSDSLLMGFFCDLDGDDETIILDEDELALAEWFEREDMPVTAEGISLTNEMMMAFKNGLVG